jgi:hypothetical protein
LLDFENKSVACANGTVETRDRVKGEFAGIDSKNYLKSNFVSGFKLTVKKQRPKR